MKVLSLISLKLKNFKGIKSFELNANGQNVSIFGDNATGKTTLFDAFCWLLFDKDSQGKKDFEIKTLDATSNVFHGIEHEVEGTFDVDGKTVTLRKVYAEKWTQKRGSAEKEFTGNETNCFVDGVPVKKNEYVAMVAELAGSEEVFKLLTSPTYFNEQLHWTKRRETLLQVCGDISDEDVIGGNKALAELPAILNGRKLEDHKKVIAGRRSELNKEIEKIPTRIDEVYRGLPDISNLIKPELLADIGSLKKLLKTKQENLLQLESGGEIAQKKIQLSTIDAEIMVIKNEHQTKLDAQIKEKRSTLNELELKRDYSLKRKISELTSDVTANDKAIEMLNTKVAQLRIRWGEVNKREFELQQDTVCPACGQDIPEAKLAEVRTKAEENFNLEKAKKLEGINAEGKTIVEDIEEVKQKNSDVQNLIDDLKSQIEEAEQEAVKLKQEIDAILQKNSIVAFQPYLDKVNEKSTVEADITNLKLGNSDAITKAKQEIETVENDITVLEKSLANVKQNEEGQKRIKDLETQEKQLSAEYANLEGELYLTEQFTRTKVKMLEEKINSRFKYARFKMFNTLVNGGVEECCETLFDGVPYSSGLNNAARINVGLDIINTLSEHYGFTAPIFVDNREAVTVLAETQAQVISLVVAEADKKLRVETNKKLVGVA